LLSFIEIERGVGKSLTGCLLVSLAGLKENVLEHTLGVAGVGAEPVLCVDNDEAGREFIEKIRAKHPNTRLHLPNKNFKNWNDQPQVARG
jgi:hypothetical protein